MKLAAALLAVALLAGPVRAQAPLTTTGTAPAVELLSAKRRAEPSTEGRARGRLVSATLHATVGGLLGAGLGFFLSQVLYSDWDRTPTHDLQGVRRTYAVTGGALGAAAGLVLGRRTVALEESALPLGEVGASTSARAITVEEIATVGGTTAFEIVQVLRPSWLNVRGVQRLSESARGRSVGDQIEVTPGLPTRLVYLDNARLGEVSALRQISREMIGGIHFFDAAAANFRWGAGHSHGVVLVTTIRAGR